MQSIKTILFPTDLSKNAINGFARVAELAKWHNAAVHVLHIIPSSPLFGLDDPRSQEDVSTEKEKAFFELLERRMPESLRGAERFKHVVRFGYSITDEIIRYAGEHSADLIVMGTHGHRSLLYPSLGGTSGGVLRQANCPVLTWRTGDGAEDDPIPNPRHILAPVDFSRHAIASLEVAKKWAVHYGARLSVLFVAEQRIVPIFSDSLIPSVHILGLEQDQIERASQALSQLLRKEPVPDIEIFTQVRTGHAAPEILAFIDEKAVDLVIMSSHGLTGSALFSLGSTSEKVVRKARCAVLTDKVRFDFDSLPDIPSEEKT